MLKRVDLIGFYSNPLTFSAFKRPKLTLTSSKKVFAILSDTSHISTILSSAKATVV
jgi:hypothetical protein